MAKNTPENRIKNATKRLLSAYNCYSLWPVPSGFGESTLDCLVCFRGHFIAIETKAPGKTPTPRQWLMIRDVVNAGGAAFVIDGDSSLAALEAWLNELERVGGSQDGKLGRPPRPAGLEGFLARAGLA